MEPSAENSFTITVERYGHPDLSAAMLRRSFRRPTIRALFLPPWRSTLGALVTAGLWPTGLLIWRLWLYGSFQRFRLGELADWAAQRHGVLDKPYAKLQRRIRPSIALCLSAAGWMVAMFCGLSLAAMLGRWLLGWSGPVPADPRRCWPMLGMVVGVSTSSILLMLATLSLRLRMTQLTERLAIWDLGLRIPRRNLDLPQFVLWPVTGFALVMPLILLHRRWTAFWLIAAIAAMLAAEVQRGYIIVADRRLRIAVARAIGRIMYGPGARR